ncbi:MAG: DUF6084 family protein [Thermomicrobium sp.]|nr:DUF6084 family protein [Thermomicrobium sp.]
MARFRFRCVDAQPDPYAATPTLRFRLLVEEATGIPVAGLLLRCQIQVHPQHRRYTASERLLLRDLFDVPERWHQTLRPLQFASVSCVVPRFARETEVELPVSCTFDFEVATARYCSVLEEGVIPFLLLFSGTAFFEEPEGLTVEQVPWESEAVYRLPVSVWRAMLDAYFPNSGWIRLSRESIFALQRFKAMHGFPTWEHTIRALLAAAGQEVP